MAIIKENNSIIFNKDINNSNIDKHKLLLNNYYNINNYSNVTNHTIIDDNTDDKNNIHVGITIGIILGSIIIISCCINYLIYEHDITKCLHMAYYIDLNEIKKKIKKIFKSIYHFILKCYCYYEYNNSEYDESYDGVYDIRNVIIDIEVPNYESNNKIINYIYDETKLFPFKNEQCSICLEISTDEQITTECNHIFCKKCIELHLKNNNKCPNCRQNINKLYNNLNDTS